MESPGVGAAQEERLPGAPFAVLHLRRFGRRMSAVVAGPFEEERDALKTATRLTRTATRGETVELLTDADSWLAEDHAERTVLVEDLAGRLLERLRKWPDDFDPLAVTARQPPGALFALAAMEAPRAARRMAGTLSGRLGHGRQPTTALVGQVLLDVPHDRAALLHDARWPVHWFPGRDRRSGASRPADAPTACAVLARRLRRGRWPGRWRGRTTMPQD